MRRRKFIKNSAVLVGGAAVGGAVLKNFEADASTVDQRVLTDDDKHGWITTGRCMNGQPVKGDVLMFQVYLPRESMDQKYPEYVFRHGYVSASKTVEFNGQSVYSVYVTMLDGKIDEIGQSDFVIRGNTFPEDHTIYPLTPEECYKL